MFIGRHLLFIPGPTHVPERILRALSGSMQDHRGPAFPPFSQALLRDIAKIFETESGQAFIFASSGTGAWEATLLDTLTPGDEVLTSSFGAVSGRAPDTRRSRRRRDSHSWARARREAWPARCWRPWWP